MGTFINDDGFIKSENIKIYPSGYRNKSDGTIINPEARINSEYNQTRPTPVDINYKSYIISKTDDEIYFNLNGYYIKIHGDNIIEDVKTTPIVYCLTASVQIGGHDDDTWVLAHLPNVETYKNLDSDDYFHGIRFMKSKDSIPKNAYSLDLSDDVKSYLVTHAKRIESTVSGKPITKNLIDGDSNNGIKQNTAKESKNNSVAFGDNTSAIGNYSFAEGCSTEASKTATHAEGYSTHATNSYSHAEGHNTEASGQASHAEGYSTHATKYTAHAEGWCTKANGDYSHSEGEGTTANKKAQHVFGKYNSQDTNTGEYGKYVEIVGNGTASNVTSNARTLDWSGNEWLAGNCEATGYFMSNSENNIAFCTDNNSFKVLGNGEVTATSYNATSDIRKKENIVEYKPERSILDLPIKKFDFIDGPKNQIGCIAQDLKDICPELVKEDEDGYLSIQESKLVYLLLDEVKKLRKEIDEGKIIQKI